MKSLVDSTSNPQDPTVWPSVVFLSVHWKPIVDSRQSQGHLKTGLSLHLLLPLGPSDSEEQTSSGTLCKGHFVIAYHTLMAIVLLETSTWQNKCPYFVIRPMIRIDALDSHTYTHVHVTGNIFAETPRALSSERQSLLI